MRSIMDEKTRLDHEHQQLNSVYQQNLKEQNDLLVLCSTYEDQLTTCANIMRKAGLQVKHPSSRRHRQARGSHFLVRLGAEFSS